MTDETTVSTDAPGKKPAQDLVPATAETLSHAAGELDTVVPKPAQALVHLEPTKRKKTWGEHVFDGVTYGGVALLGNEATSMVITGSVKEGKAAHSLYKKFEAPFAALSKHVTKAGKQMFPAYFTGHGTGGSPRLPFLLVATIGGMFMVPIVKFLEDRKGDIVRKLDRSHYGNKVDSDANLVEAHKEMDDAPKQSWGSLGKGRVTTVIAAAIGDATFGWHDALTTKIFKGPTAEKYSSLDRLASTLSFKLVDRFSKDAPENKKLMEQSYLSSLDKKIAPLSKAEQQVFGATSAGKWFGRVQNGTWLLTLSATLTALFYVSSKLFAKKRDQKIERQYNDLTGAPARDGDETTTTAQPQVDLASAITTPNPAPGKPRPQVTNVALASTLAPAEQLAQGA